MKGGKITPSNILKYGTIIKKKWKALHQIGQGAFGQIYAGIDLQSSKEVALKVERRDSRKTVLILEVVALKKLQKSSKVVRYIHSGRQDHFNFLVLERLGYDIAMVKRCTKRGRFSLGTTLRLGVEMINCIETVHKLGFVHRDIKPSNFCLGRGKEGKKNLYLIDFHLASRYILPNGAIRPPRKDPGFRGTSRYASINCHQNKDQSRRDDIWSVFYILVEYSLGRLPWNSFCEKKHIRELKERFTNEELVKDLSPEMTFFLRHLKGLKFEDVPDYDLLRKYLLRALSRLGQEMKFDWERPEMMKRDGARKTRMNEKSSGSGSTTTSLSCSSTTSFVSSI